MNNSEVIHIVFAIDNNYVKQCCVTINSILFNSNKSDFYHFHILESGLNEKSKSKFVFKHFKNYGITFYDVTNINTEKFCTTFNHITVTTYYRLYIAQILPDNIDKVIYLDCDLIAVRDLKDLWEIDLDDYSAGVIEDWIHTFDWLKPFVQENHIYFNAGVIVFNLKELRSFNFLEECLAFNDKMRSKLICQDQDILNCVLSGRCKYLPVSWNMITAFFVDNHSKMLDEKEFEQYKQHPGIYHYPDIYKPWIFKYYSPKKKVYQKYLVMTNTFWENIIYYLIVLSRFICSVSLFYSQKTFKIFNIPIYERCSKKRKIIKLFGIPVYYKFRVKDSFREYIFCFRLK